MDKVKVIEQLQYIIDEYQSDGSACCVDRDDVELFKCIIAEFEQPNKHIVDDNKTINEPLDIENAVLCGYRLRDLIALSHVMENNNIRPDDLKSASTMYEKGYSEANNQFKKQLDIQFNGIMEYGRKPERTDK